jgi:glutamine phosphoribosylpyrophosphate amidotransferase
LIAATHTEDEMRKILGVKSLRFNTPENYAEAIISAQSEERKEKNPLKIQNLCLGCFTGEFPQYK